MIKRRVIFCIVLALTATVLEDSNAQSTLERLVKERLREQDNRNRQDAERRGDYSPPPNTAPAKEAVSSSDGKVGVDVDIKGIKIGVTRAVLERLIQGAGTDLQKCFKKQFSRSDQGYEFRDFLIKCDESFSYFGVNAPFAEFNLIDDALVAVRIGSYSSSNRDGDRLPPIVRALADEKFKQAPKISNDTSGLSPSFRDRMGKQESIWVDPAGNRLRYTTDYEVELSGVSFKNGTLNMLSARFEEIVSRRQDELRDAARQRQNTLEAQRKKDM